MPPPQSLEEQYPHPLSDYGRFMLLHAFKRALIAGHHEEAARLEQFARPDEELSQWMRQAREQIENDFA